MTSVGGKFVNFRDDGILGLANPQLAEGVPTFMDQLTAAGLQNTFSVCYGSYDGGQLVLGGVDSSLEASGSNAPITVAMDQSAGFYEVKVKGFRMKGGLSYDLPAGLNTAILDTGTTLLTMKDPYFSNQLVFWIGQAATATLTGDALDRINAVLAAPGNFHCFSGTELASFVPCLPPLEVAFEDVSGQEQTVAIPMSSVLWLYQLPSLCGTDYAVALSVIATDDGDYDLTLGDTFLRNVYTEFNRAASTATFRAPNSSLCGTSIPGLTDTTKCGATIVPPNSGPVLSIPLLIGLACAGAAVVAAIIVAIVCCCRARKRKHHRQTPAYTAVSSGGKDLEGVVEHRYQNRIAPVAVAPLPVK